MGVQQFRSNIRPRSLHWLSQLTGPGEDHIAYRNVMMWDCRLKGKSGIVLGNVEEAQAEVNQHTLVRILPRDKNVPHRNVTVKYMTMAEVSNGWRTTPVSTQDELHSQAAHL